MSCALIKLSGALDKETLTNMVIYDCINVVFVAVKSPVEGE